MVEFARGSRKRASELTSEELARAIRITEVKQALMALWVELVTELGEDGWVPQTEIVLAVGNRQVGMSDRPVDYTLPEWEAEIARLEAAVEFKRLAQGSQN